MRCARVDVAAFAESVRLCAFLREIFAARAFALSPRANVLLREHEK
jgi:hypothetical protein